MTMRDIWETWVSDQTVDDFLADVDALVAEGTFPDRRAAFVAYAGYVLPELGRAPAGPDLAEDSLSAVKLAELLLTHAAAAERRGRPARRRKVAGAGRCGGARVRRQTSWHSVPASR
jgi:hypothetical protein